MMRYKNIWATARRRWQWSIWPNAKESIRFFLDRNYFSIYRTSRKQAFRILPEVD
jgi:hypothetical protein